MPKKTPQKFQVSFIVEINPPPNADDAVDDVALYVADMVTEIWDGTREKDRKVFLDSYDFQATPLND